MLPSEVRRYFRERKLQQRRALAQEGHYTFHPRIIRYETCSYCHQEHPVLAILPNGSLVRLTLDSYHKESDIMNYYHTIRGLMKIDEAKLLTKDPLTRCIAERMREKDETEEEARRACEKIQADPAVQELTAILQKDLDEALPTPMQMCARARMDLYQETREIAEHNCQIIMNDPMYRHNPPGLILAPAAVDSNPHESRDPRKRFLDKCFAEKIRKGVDPKDAVNRCIVEFHQEEEKEKEETPKATVGDLYGKSPAEIAAMVAELEDFTTMTLPRLYGKTKKQILKEQDDAREHGN